MKTHSKIRQLRDIKGYSQEYMASKLDISQNTYSRIENGIISLSMDRLHKIANILNTEVHQILDFDEDKLFGKATRFAKCNCESNVNMIRLYKNYVQHLEHEVAFLRTLLAANKVELK